MTTLDDFFAEQMQRPAFARAWAREQRRQKRHPEHVAVQQVSPRRGRWFCWICGRRLKKSEQTAICRVAAKRLRLNNARTTR